MPDVEVQSDCRPTDVEMDHLYPIAEKIREGLGRFGFSRSEFAQRLQISPAHVTRLCDTKTPSDRLARDIAVLLQLNETEFLRECKFQRLDEIVKNELLTAERDRATLQAHGQVGESVNSYGEKGAVRLMAVPIIGEVSADPEIHIEFNDEAEQMKRVGEWFDPPLSAASYGLRVASGSMEPIVRKGQVVIVDPQRDAQDGDLCVVVLRNGARLFKRLQCIPGLETHVILQSQHAGYTDAPVPWTDIERCEMVRACLYG